MNLLREIWGGCIGEYKRRRAVKNLRAVLNSIPPRPATITKETRYSVVTNISKGLFRTERIIKYTNIPCYPIEFVPEDEILKSVQY